MSAVPGFSNFLSLGGQVTLSLPATWTREEDERAVLLFEDPHPGTLFLSVMTFEYPKEKEFCPPTGAVQVPCGGWFTESMSESEDEFGKLILTTWEVNHFERPFLTDIVLTWAVGEEESKLPKSQSNHTIVRNAVIGLKLNS